jgi:hypothetical protein
MHFGTGSCRVFRLSDWLIELTKRMTAKMGVYKGECSISESSESFVWETRKSGSVQADGVLYPGVFYNPPYHKWEVTVYVRRQTLICI